MRRFARWLGLVLRWWGDFLWAWGCLGEKGELGDYAHFWWHTEFAYRVDRWRERLMPHGQPCADCGRPWKRWWREQPHDPTCLPF